MTEQGSFKDIASMQSETGDLYAFFLERLVTVMGLLEWLGVDLKKKGATAKVERIEELSERLESMADRAEKLERTFRDPQCDFMGSASPGDLEERTRIHEGLRLDIVETEGAIEAMTGEGAVFSMDEVEGLSGRLNRIEKGIQADEEAFGGDSESC